MLFMRYRYTSQFGGVSAMLEIQVSSYYFHRHVLVYVGIGSLYFLVQFHCIVKKIPAEPF